MAFSNSVGRTICIQYNIIISLLCLCLFSISLGLLTDDVNKLENKFQEKVTEKDASTQGNIEFIAQIN